MLEHMTKTTCSEDTDNQAVAGHADEKLQLVTESVGQFVEYWGFRNIHGRIWAVVFLSPRPISTLEIIQRLEVSKGLISRAVNELLDYGLIRCAGNTVYARRTYIACEDVGSIVGSVLRDREMSLLRRNVESLSMLSKCSRADLKEMGVAPQKLHQLLQLTKENEGLLQAFLRRKFKTLSDWISFTKRARSFLRI